MVEKLFCSYLIGASVRLVCVCVLSLRSSRKSFSVFSLPAHQVLEDGNKVTPLPSLHKTESRALSASSGLHVLPGPSRRAGSLLGLLQFFLYRGARSWTLHVRGSLINVEWKEIILCARATQNRNSVCGKVHETLEAIIRDRYETSMFLVLRIWALQISFFCHNKTENFLHTY